MHPRIPQAHPERHRPALQASRWGLASVSCLVLLAMAAGCGRPTSAPRSDTSPVLASVDGRVITAEAFRHHWEDQRMATNTPVLREQLLEQLIQRSALAAAARREGFDQDPVVQQEIDFLLARRLRTTRLQHRMKSIEVTDAAVRESYERDRDTRFTEPAAVRAAVLWFNTRGQPPLEERYRPRLDGVRTRFLTDPSWITASNGFGRSP